MTQFDEKVTRPWHKVYSISEYLKDGEVKSSWLSIGVAFQNKDNSFNIVLRALPIPDPQTGLVRLHMRLPSTSKENGQTGTDLEDTFQIFDIPLSEL